MPKRFRLSHAELVRLSKVKSTRTHGAYFSLTSTLFPAWGGPKSACVISKKIAARAVDRNRVQRRCREIIRPFIMRIQQPYALVFHAKRGSAALSFEDTQKDVEAILARAGVLA